MHVINTAASTADREMFDVTTFMMSSVFRPDLCDRCLCVIPRPRYHTADAGGTENGVQRWIVGSRGSVGFLSSPTTTP